jgi:hypothetical protein
MEGRHNNATSAKNNYHPNIVILASDEANLVGVQGSDMPPLAVEQPLESTKKFATKVYPNPTDDLISVEFAEAPGPGLSIWISDVMGKVYACQLPDTNRQQLAVPVGDLKLKPGHYFLMISHEDKWEIIRFQKK